MTSNILKEIKDNAKQIMSVYAKSNINSHLHKANDIFQFFMKCRKYPNNISFSHFRQRLICVYRMCISSTFLRFFSLWRQKSIWRCPSMDDALATLRLSNRNSERVPKTFDWYFWRHLTCDVRKKRIKWQVLVRSSVRWPSHVLMMWSH